MRGLYNRITLSSFGVSTRSFASTSLNIKDFPAEKLGAFSVRTMYLMSAERGRDLIVNERVRLVEEVDIRGDIVEKVLTSNSAIRSLILSYLTYDRLCNNGGWILPSPYLPFAYGNVGESSLESLWEQECGNFKISEEISTEKDLKFE